MKAGEIEMVAAQLEDQVRVCQDHHVQVPQVGGGLPVELRRGYHEGDVTILLHGVGGSAVLAKVRVEDLRVAVDQVEALPELPR